jgi:hypothetical protein
MQFYLLIDYFLISFESFEKLKKSLLIMPRFKVGSGIESGRIINPDPQHYFILIFWHLKSVFATLVQHLYVSFAFVGIK